MASGTLIPCYWDGAHFIPTGPGHVARADREFGRGEVVTLTRWEPRSQRSHNHQFAEVHEAWQNLREADGMQFPTPEHLRKHALIMCGYATRTDYPCGTKAEAQRWAHRLSGMDAYAVVTISETVVTVWQAESQSTRAMGKRRFQESKTAILNWLADRIGTAPETLTANAGRAA